MTMRMTSGVLSATALSLALVFVTAVPADARSERLRGAIIGAGVGGLVGGTEGAAVGGISGAVIGSRFR